MEKVRIDKWLWSVRIFKSRTLATDACRTGKIKIEGQSVKASTLLEPEQLVEVRKNGFNMKYKALQLIDKRVGAPIAQTCYEDLTPIEELNKYNELFIGKASPEKREKGAGRPTKKQRRTLDRYKKDS